jgi:hypothetical protein
VHLFGLAGVSTIAWCGVYMFIRRFLMMVSLLFSLTLAVGLALQVRRSVESLPGWLWYSPVAVIPLAFVFNIPLIIWPAGPSIHPELNSLPCFSGQYTFEIEVVVIFFLLAVLHVTIVAQAWNSAPHSVTRRSMLNASRYIVSFFVTYIVHVAYHVWFWIDPDARGKCSYHVMRIAGATLSYLNGFFNFLAFWIHVRRMQSRRRLAASVAFRDADMLEETKEIPHGEECRKSVPKNQRSHRPPSSCNLFADVNSAGSLPGSKGSLGTENESELGDFLAELYADRSASARTSKDVITEDNSCDRINSTKSDGFCDEESPKPCLLHSSWPRAWSPADK